MAQPRKTPRPKAPSALSTDHHLRLCRVLPTAGYPWTGTLVNPQYSEMGMTLRHAQDHAAKTGGDPDKYVIVRCVDPGGQEALQAGADYLVLRSFVQPC